MAARTPARIRIRMYQVGFGDCFLLSFEYARKLADGRSARHVLIDFGSTRLESGVGLADVAKLVATHCEGKLDAVVLSHRHKDHMSGFGDAKAKPLLDPLSPDLVVRPWTEDPKARANARSLRGKYVRSLAGAQEFAAAVAARIEPAAHGLLGELRAYAADQVSNKEAIDTLDAWAKAGEGEYLSVGDATKLSKLLPGVTVSVLGPPTIDDWPDVAGRRENDPEYWLRLSKELGSAALSLDRAIDEAQRAEQGQTAAADRYTDRPGPVRWLIEHMRRQRLFLVQRIVRSLDDALNNTSLILLFEAGGRRLLFSGDAQIENWEYVLDHYPKRARLLAKLQPIDLYKVGHHGSRNATPKGGLYERWAKGRKQMTSLVSTKEDVHGKTEGTKVPRASLLGALRSLGELHSTHELAKGETYVEVVAPVGGRGGFRLVR